MQYILIISFLSITLIIFFVNLNVYGNQANEISVLLLPYNFIWEHYNATPPWYSALAQGEALPILIKAYKLTGMEIYKKTAEGVINSFFVDVKEGGVTHKEGNAWWYELYASKGSKNPKVLNGMLWTLLALHEYYSLTKDLKAKLLFENGLQALKKNLHLYDSEKFTYYDVLKTQANYDYHKVHIDLLNKLYSMTGEEIFKNYSQKWAAIPIKKPPHIESPTIYLDEYYIPFVDYGERNGSFIGIQRNPLTVDHVARDYYEKYIEFEDQFFKEAFLNNAKWLVNNAVEMNLSTKDK